MRQPWTASIFSPSVERALLKVQVRSVCSIPHAHPTSAPLLSHQASPKLSPQAAACRAKEKVVHTPENKQQPSLHQGKVSSDYVPVFSCTVPGEDEEDAFCDIQNTPVKWLFQSKSFPTLRDRGGDLQAGRAATETFCSCWSQKQFDLSPQVWDQFSTTTPRDEFSCLNTGIGSFVTEHLQHLCGLGDKTQTYSQAGPSETGTKPPWAYQTALSLLQGLLSWALHLGWAQ